jgi:hypothetical protein
MARDAIFGRGRVWRPEDRAYRRLRLGPGDGATIGEYASREPNEYSDSYYGPGDDYPNRTDPSDGYARHHYDPPPNVSAPPGGSRRFRATADRGYIGYGRLQPGERSWADLGVSSVGGGAADVNGPSFQGRGPKGYAPTDQRLRDRICERLTDDPLVDASDVDVQVKSGEVTLSGSVRDRKMKWRAEDLVEDSTRGALVHNRLRVQRSESS